MQKQWSKISVRIQGLQKNEKWHNKDTGLERPLVFLNRRTVLYSAVLPIIKSTQDTNHPFY